MSKPGGKSGGKAEAAPPPPVDPTVDLRSLQQVTTLLSKAKHMRNYFQLERDKIHKFWDISKKELENLQYELLNAEHELEDTESRHQIELKVYKQKVRHLLYEHKMQVQEVRQRSEKELVDCTLEHQQRMVELRREKQVLHSVIDTTTNEFDDSVTAEHDHHHRVMNVKAQGFDKALDDARSRYEDKISRLRSELELRRRAEIHEIEERKNEHINELIKKHEAAFHEMKAYYNQITSNNLDLIRSLKEEIANMKRNDEHNEALMYDIERENMNLNEPLELAKREVAELMQQLHNYEKDKLSLRNTRCRLRALETEFQTLREEHEQLRNKYADVQGDRDSLVGKFEAALREASEVVSDRNTALQQQLTEIVAKTDERDAQLQAVLTAVHLEPAALGTITQGLEDTLEAKSRALKDLHFELRKVEKHHHDIIDEYHRRARAAGLPTLDISAILQSATTTTTGQTSATVGAGQQQTTATASASARSP